MSIFSCFPKREAVIKKPYEIDLSLYEQLEYLSEEVYEASINKLVNVCLENLFVTKKFELYIKPRNEKTVSRSLVLRKSIYDNLVKYRNKYKLSYNKIINIAIRNALIEEGLL